MGGTSGTPPRSKGGQRAQAKISTKKKLMFASDQGGLFPTEERADRQGECERRSGVQVPSVW